MTDTQTHFTVGPSQKEGMSSADQASVNVSLWPGGFDPVKENDSHMWALAQRNMGTLKCSFFTGLRDYAFSLSYRPQHSDELYVWKLLCALSNGDSDDNSGSSSSSSYSSSSLSSLFICNNLAQKLVKFLECIYLILGPGSNGLC